MNTSLPDSTTAIPTWKVANSGPIDHLFSTLRALSSGKGLFKSNKDINILPSSSRTSNQPLLGFWGLIETSMLNGQAFRDRFGSFDGGHIDCKLNFLFNLFSELLSPSSSGHRLPS
eukprot:Gb_31820 [translate_table: standard]